MPQVSPGRTRLRDMNRQVQIQTHTLQMLLGDLEHDLAEHAAPTAGDIKALLDTVLLFAGVLLHYEQTS